MMMSNNTRSTLASPRRPPPRLHLGPRPRPPARPSWPHHLRHPNRPLAGTDAADHLAFALDGEPFHLPEGYLSTWRSPDGTLTVERTASRNSVAVAVGEVAEVMVNVVPVTAEDDKVHGYGIPAGDCFAQLEVQFSFYRLSPEVEGVLGRTCRPDFRSNAKVGVAMAVVGRGSWAARTSTGLRLWWPPIAIAASLLRWRRID